MCFERKFVFVKNAQHLNDIFLADSKKKMMLTWRGGLLVVAQAAQIGSMCTSLRFH